MGECKLSGTKNILYRFCDESPVTARYNIAANAFSLIPTQHANCWVKHQQISRSRHEQIQPSLDTALKIEKAIPGR